jgi:hypothetical protein
MLYRSERLLQNGYGSPFSCLPLLSLGSWGLKPVSLQVSGQDILAAMAEPSGSKVKYFRRMHGTLNSSSDKVQVTLMYEGQATVWHIPISTSTRTLYCLANRATKARYSRFTLRLVSSKAIINDLASLTLGLTDLSHGGVIEISFAVVHKRKLSEVIVRDWSGDIKQTVLLPQDAPILALISYLDPIKFGSISSMQMWYVSRCGGIFPK